MGEQGKPPQPDVDQWMLLEMVADGVLVVNETGVILYANTRVQHLLGYAPLELFGRHVNVLLDAAIANAHDRMRSAYHHAPKTREMGGALSIEALHRDGGYVPLEIHLQPLADTGLVVASIRRRDARPASAIDWTGIATRERESRALLDLVIQRLYGIALSLGTIGSRPSGAAPSIAFPNDHAAADSSAAAEANREVGKPSTESELERSTAVIDETIDLIRTAILELAGRGDNLAVIQAQLIAQQQRRRVQG